MNLIPSMLIATTLIGGSGNIAADTSSVDTGKLQEQLNNSCITGQVIVGNSSNIESILNGLGVNIESLKDCLNPVLPNDKPEGDTNTPDTDKPGNDTDAPGADNPGGGINPPGTDQPDGDLNLPDADKPDNDTNQPGTDIPGGNESNPDQDENKNYAQQVVELVNTERTKAGLSALTMSDGLNAAALIRARETTQSFSHTRPDGSSFSSVLNENGISYRGSGENIAWGQATPEAVVNAWMNSEGHRANILNKDYTSIGVGYYLNGTTPYWAQLFTY